MSKRVKNSANLVRLTIDMLQLKIKSSFQNTLERIIKTTSLGDMILVKETVEVLFGWRRMEKESLIQMGTLFNQDTFNDHLKFH